MRKTNPVDVRADFAAGLSDVTASYATVQAALTSDKDKTLLVEHTFLAAAVLWEGFISDLIIAYINRDPSRFARHLKDALVTGLTPKQNLIYANYGSLKVPPHIRKADVVSLIDPSGNNVTFSNFADLGGAAARWLSTANAGRIMGRTAAQKATVDAIIAIRNHIAHRSDRSLKAMNGALRAGALHGTGIRRGVNSVRHVGSYLKATPAGVRADQHLPPRNGDDRSRSLACGRGVPLIARTPDAAHN